MSQSLSQLPVGTLVADFNTKYNDEPIIWQVLEHGHSGDPEGSTTLCSLNIITLKCFDAIEASNSDSSRKSYGNNRYLHSNLLQWLNSDAAAGAWYSAKHSADAAPTNANVYGSFNEYDQEKGFLADFSAELKAALLTVNKTTAKNTVTDGGSYETIGSKIFLESTTEVGLANENNIAEGTIYEYYNQDNTNARRVRKPTAEAVSNSERKSENLDVTKGYYYFLRTPITNDSYNVRLVSLDGSLNVNPAFRGDNGVVPCLCIPSTTKVGDEPAADGVYTLFPGWNVKKAYLGDSNNEAVSIYKDPVKIVSWQNGTDEEIGAMIDAYYNNDLSLEDIQSVWSVGDTRTISLSAMAATGVGESHRVQDVEMTILDFEIDTLVTPINNHTKALISVQMKNCLRDANVSDTGGSSNTENGYMNSSNVNNTGWNSCARRIWCNNIFYNALSNGFKSMIKQVYKSTAHSGNTSSPTWVANTDYCWLASEWEVFGANTQSAEGGYNTTHYINSTSGSNTITLPTGGTQYAYYKIAANRCKLPKWSSSYVSDSWWERSPYKSIATAFCCVDNGDVGGHVAGDAYGLAPACCL